MGILQIAFVAINLFVPYWLWMRGAGGPPVKIAWPAAEATIARLLEASGGLNCPTADVVKHIRALCDRSMGDWSESETVAYRQQLGDQLYSCEVRKDSLQLKITPTPAAAPNEPCLAADSFGSLYLAPGFTLTLKGFVNAMSFVGTDQNRHNFSVRNCRRKLKKTAGMPAATPEDLDEALGQDVKDPPEYRAVNRLCWVYDLAPGWNAWRGQFTKN